jgi:hypothetical protein
MTSNPTRPHNPQLSAAHALVQLLTLHPELPRIDWSVSAESGGLSGSYWDAPASSVHAIAGVLGGEAGDPWLNRHSGRTLQAVHAVFQDVPVMVTVYTVPALTSAVAA